MGSKPRRGLNIALAWLDLDDPTDRAIALGLAARLRERGHSVTLVGPRRRRSARRLDSASGFRVVRVGRPPDGDGRDAQRELLALQRRAGFDVWHAIAFGRGHRALAAAARRGRFKLLVTLQLVLDDYLPAAPGLERLLRSAYHVSAESAYGLARARAAFPFLSGRGSVVPNAPADPEPGPGAGAPRGPFALCASRLAPYKGLDVLLMAFAALRARGSRLRLVLCGRDQLRGGLRRFARTLGLGGAVVFAGALERARLGAWLRRCRLFLLPSRRDNLPLALLEAMAAGRPIVATRAGGVGEAVRHRREALLVKPGDARGLASAIDALDRDAALRRRLGAAARRRSRRFSWERSARRYEELYALR